MSAAPKLKSTWGRREHAAAPPRGGRAEFPRGAHSCSLARTVGGLTHCGSPAADVNGHSRSSNAFKKASERDDTTSQCSGMMDSGSCSCQLQCVHVVVSMLALSGFSSVHVVGLQTPVAPQAPTVQLSNGIVMPRVLLGMGAHRTRALSQPGCACTLSSLHAHGIRSERGLLRK